ncbi:Carbohydrate-Binding Module Family 50 protein [Glomus cerebriforme]|uniref:Carbohydrate-Binding Module Family 50 protein n=1 Tax=Glomus cerebriforme TaxID=658196 RepID=A0A397TF50_9GLOM|nr:Carbohydrate-Binding Module Family 50 protein [Glomus cerebriforme]
MENKCFRTWPSNYGTLDLSNLPVNDAPPKVFFPPKMSLKKELEYKKKRPILEHISTSISSPHKLALNPTTSHPLNHQITTSPITPPFFNKFNQNEILSDGTNKRHSFKIDITGNEIVKQTCNNNNLRKISSLPDISINTKLKNDLLKEGDNNKKKMVIVHEVKPIDTIAGVALFYGIELSILKKANKLWTNDSIHLRKFLYIPIDQCSIIDDETKVVIQDDHISIKTNRTFSDNIIRPSISPNSATSTPFTIYERELLFCTLPEHADYVNNDYNHSLHSRQTSHTSTPSTWSITSSTSSISSTTSSNNNNANNFTRAEIQQLPADQLTYFPSRRMCLPSNSSQTPPDIPLITPTLPSLSPVSHSNRHKLHHSLSFPLPTMKQNLDNDKIRCDIMSDSYNTELLTSLNKVCNKKDPRFVSPTFIRKTKHV